MKVSCEACGRQYQVDAKMAGRTVKCKACDHRFTIPAAEESPLDDGFADLPAQPTEPTPLGGQAHALPKAPVGTATEGPSDKMMRLVSLGMFFAGLLLLGVNHAKAVMDNEVYLFALALGPFALTLGIAGMISPNVVRAAGKYGKHLPVRYKLIAGLAGLAALIICLLLVFVVYSFG